MARADTRPADDGAELRRRSLADRCRGLAMKELREPTKKAGGEERAVRG